MKEVNFVEGKKRLVADREEKITAVVATAVMAVICALAFYFSRDESVTPAVFAGGVLLLGGFLLACIYLIISKSTDFIDVTDSAVYQHRFLLPDRSFRFDEITGMRFNHYYRDPERITLFIGGRRIFSLTRPRNGKPDFLWSRIASEDYPLRYYKGEDARHFTVGLHSETFFAIIVPASVLMVTVCSLLSGDDYGSFTAWLLQYFLPFLGIFLAALLQLPIFSLRIRVDGDTVRAGRLFLRKSAHVSELYCVVNSNGLMPVPELRFRDGGRSFVKIDFRDVENLLALKKYLSDHGLSCKGFPEL